MKKIYSCLLLAAFCSINFCANAQVLSFSEVSDGVLFQLSSSRSMKIAVCSDNVVRVMYAAQAAIPAKTSLVVVNEPGGASFTASEDAQSVSIQTALLKVIVSKTDANIGFYDTSANLLLQEDSKSMSAYSIWGIQTNKCIATFNFSANEAIYGLGQHQQGIMNYVGKTQKLQQDNMEIALPIVISNKGYGIMWENYSTTLFEGNISASTKYRFTSDAGDLVDYYFMYGPKSDKIIAAYRNLTGTAPLFPKWAYGLFQSQDRYDTADELLKASNAYRKKRIPLDAIVQDWKYWEPYSQGSHKMNLTKYPDPAKLIDSLHKINIHAMISIWPNFTEGDDNYKELAAISNFYPSTGRGHCYDPHNAQAREIYWKQVRDNLFGKYGWDAWWSDGNEPDPYPDAFSSDGNPRETVKNTNIALGKAGQFTNSYPLVHSDGFYTGWRKDIPGKRAFTLSRSAFIGQQRDAITCWSGDIWGNWEDFKKQLPAGLNFSISGIPYWTTDIGGYWANSWATPDNRELFTRWFQYGTFCPIFRIHGKLERAIYSELSWDEVTRNTLIKFDKLRYRLMPYIYSNAWKVTNEHYTVMRHLIMDYPNDTKVFNISNQFLFGPFMMINPVADKQVFSRSVYFPEGTWYDFWTGETLEGNTTRTVNSPIDFIPVYVKAGSIIPMGPEIEYANQSSDPIEIRIYKGADAEFDLYEDAGDSYKYEDGEYTVIPLTYKEDEKTLTIGNRVGNYPGMLSNRTFKIVWVEKNYGTGVEFPITCDETVQYSGSEAKVTFADRKVYPNHYEAEEAELTGSISTANTNKGYNGSGYVVASNDTEFSSVNFNIQVKNAGSYIVKMRYSAPYENASPTLNIYTNDMFVATLFCNKTVNWNSWSEVSQMVYLKEGDNIISYKTNSKEISLDCIDLTIPADPAILNIDIKKIAKIKLYNTELYLNGATVLNTPVQIWKIEKVEGNYYKISINETTQCLTASGENDAVTLTDYTGSVYQQWLIEDYGYNVVKITARQSGKTLSAESGNVLQLTEQDLVSQRWVLESAANIGTGTGLEGGYYQGTNFNTFEYKRIDPRVIFDWGTWAPGNFSIRWTGQVQPQYTDEYTFITRSDDGVRLWIDGQRIINNWSAQALTENKGKITLEAGKLYDIKLEYFQGGGDASVSLAWECSSLEQEFIPQTQLYPPPIVHCPPIPTTATITAGKETLLPGETTTITLVSSLNDLTYTLYLNGIAVPSSEKAGNGNNLMWTVGKKGKYTIKAVGNGVTYCSTAATMNKSIIITVTGIECTSLQYDRTGWNAMVAYSKNAILVWGAPNDVFRGSAWSALVMFESGTEFMVDMQKTLQINQIVMKNEGDDWERRLLEYELYVSDDGINWGTAVTSGSFRDAAKSPLVIDLSENLQITRHFKIVYLGNGYQWSIDELWVNGEECEDICAPIPTSTAITASGTTITLASSLSGVTYKLYLDGVAVSNSNKNGKDNEPLVWTVSETGRYTIKAIGDGVVYCNEEVVFTGEVIVGIPGSIGSGQIVIGYYDTLGRKLNSEPLSGIYIIKYADGTAKKIVK